MTPAPLIAVLAMVTSLPAYGPGGWSVTADSADTLRPRAAAAARQRGTTREAGSVVSGYLSPRGLPPRPGEVIVTDSGLVFMASDGASVQTYPLVGPVRFAEGRRWRASAVSLAYVETDGDDQLYVFRLDGGVFATDGPAALLAVAERPEWLDTLDSREWTNDRPLVAPHDSVGGRAITERIAGSAYADTLYALFGRPVRPFGQVGARGRRAGRLAEYMGVKDSLALDPGRMTSEDQLRHALAHELGHRWQSRAPRQLAVLWQDVPRIRDPKRYGHGSASEHQAEAIAFAVHFLQATAARAPADPRLLLEQYERMVPGTSLLARYLALQPIYASHPLRHDLTTGGSR